VLDVVAFDVRSHGAARKAAAAVARVQRAADGTRRDAIVTGIRKGLARARHDAWIDA